MSGMLTASINTEIVQEIIKIVFEITKGEDATFDKMLEYIKNITLSYGEKEKGLKDPANLQELNKFWPLIDMVKKFDNLFS